MITTITSESTVLKQKVITYVWPIATSFFIIYILLSFFVFKDSFAGWILLVDFFVFIIIMLIYFKTKNVWLAGNALATLGIPVLLPWLISGGPSGVGFWWSLVYVIWTFIVTDKKSAVFWLLIHLILSVIIVVLSLQGIIKIAYPIPILLNLLYAYVITILYTYFLILVLDYYLKLAQKRTTELNNLNQELEAFSYSVSHDLRTPLRAINAYSKILQEDCVSKLGTDEMGFLNSILNNSKKMENLIDDLLAFSKLGRTEIIIAEINMDALVKSVIEDEMTLNSNKIEFKINELQPSKGTQSLIKQVWVNLISNAIKYSKHNPKSKIEIGSYIKDNFIIYYVKDNGAGFDMQYYDKLFGVFQRLHSQEEFEGTGIGLAIVQKIIQRHNGIVWAESKLNEGACFYFSLPVIES